MHLIYAANHLTCVNFKLFYLSIDVYYLFLAIEVVDDLFIIFLWRLIILIIKVNLTKFGIECLGTLRGIIKELRLTLICLCGILLQHFAIPEFFNHRLSM